MVGLSSINSSCFPALLKRAARRADIVHITDHSNAIYVSSLKGKPLLLTCNDVIAIRSALGLVPQNATGAAGKLLQKLILRGLKRVPRVACISENTRRELLEVSGRSPAATTVIEMGLNYPYSPMPAEPARTHLRALIGEPRAERALRRGTVLHVGANDWYKNRIGVLRIYSHVRRADPERAPMLILAGKPLDEASQQVLESLDLENDVIKIHGSSNEELRALYSLAEALLFPSLAEGFGWPIAEAQACGCRVVTTGAAPMTQVGGDAAVYIDPTDEIAAARCVRALLDESETAKRERIAAGLRHSEQFSARRMVDSYLDAYQDIISSAR